jgi:outer membrane lipoprotein-sorting protein
LKERGQLVVNKLENLKDKMDSTILKDVYFDAKQYQQVLSSIENSKNDKNRSLLKNKFNYLLSFSVVSIMFLGITYFVGTQLNLLNDPETKQNTQDSLNKPSNEKSAYIPPKQEENYDEMSKEEILTKMINSVDYFETARGEYKMHYSFSPGYETVEYAISLKQEPGGYGKRTLDTGEITSREFYKDGKVWSINESLKTYMEFRANRNSGTTLTLDQAFSTASDGNPQTNYRERPPISTANETLFPYEIASNYTRDLTKWEIEKQNEELLGHNTLVIKGIKNHRDFQSFRFWVDKDTGILIKYETYKANGDIVDYLHPTKLEVNVPIDTKLFTPDLEGYVPNSRDKEKVIIDPRENEVVPVAGTKSSSEIEDVYNLMKSDMPFLYGFNHSDLQLISASYETFKEYKIGYLYYILDPDNDHNSSQMLSVRVHHKDSYVRKIGDFEIVGDTTVSPFQLNEIKWKGTSLKETDGEWVHLTGQKGDYIYDVVSQHISLDETKDFLKGFKEAH